MTHPVLTALGLNAEESGTYLGNGEWSKTTDAGVLEPVNPDKGEVLGKVYASSKADYELIVQRAQAAFRSWRTAPAPRRGEAIRLCAEALRKHKDALGSLVALEMGKSKPEGDGEVQEMIDIGEFAVGLSRQLYGLTMHSERPGHRMYEQWHPLGLVGIISAFNFPVAVWSWNAFIAAVCGDVCIWKPSPKTPLSAIASMKICNEALRAGGFPDIFFLFNDAGSDLAQAFVDDKRIPLISFTGSTRVGRLVGERVARRMGRSLLELGGNNAIIVDPSADLKLAIPAIVFGAVGTAGQRCTSTRRLFVHESIYDSVLEKLVSAYKQVGQKIGDPTDPKNLMGPLNSRDAVQAYLSAIEQARAAGGKVETGGAALDRPGFYVLPAIVTGLKNSDAIVQQETFAPILYVMKYSELEQAIEMQNDVPQGLSSAIFTQNLKAAEAFLSAAGSDCGIANVNIGTSGAEIGGAFGGEKETGGGRESGSDAWKAYMRR
ncbi:MAG TPA: aldehyde dehydrogenase family protein, partial [Arenimonas sp.]|nr:aldehyde dehydrogenase family protein [Arenimonas sp.]